MISKESIENTFVAMLSGIAEYKNKKEIYIQIGCTKKTHTIEFLCGSSEAIVRAYYANGKKRFEAPYLKFRRHGIYTSWTARGKIKEMGRYFQGKRHGKWKTEFGTGQYLNGRKNGRFEHSDGSWMLYSWGHLVNCSRWPKDSIYI